MKRKTKQANAATLSEAMQPAVQEIMRRLTPPEEVRRHFQSARLELLKGIRALLDARIERLSKGKSKGEQIEIE